MRNHCLLLQAALICISGAVWGQETPVATPPIVLHAARLFDVSAGKIVTPGEVLVEGERITAAGTSVPHPAGAETIDLGDTTLMPGLIDVHVHLFLHPGAEDLQTVEESVPQRTILADAGGEGRSDGRIHGRARYGDGGCGFGGHRVDAGD